MARLLALVRQIAVYVWFNIGGILVFPVFLLRPFNRNNDWYFGQLVGGVALKIMGITYELDHPEYFTSESKVWVANHQNSLDLFLLSFLVPKGTVVVGKKSLKWIPIFGQVFWLGGNFLIDRGNRSNALGVMDQVKDSLVENKGPVFVLPEGTRSRGSGLGKFKKGAFYTAIAAEVPVQAIVIPHFHQQINLGKWHAGHLKIKVLPPFPTKGKTFEQLDSFVDEVRNAFVKAIGEGRVESKAESTCA